MHDINNNSNRLRGPGKLAYLLSQYPGVSHTFFLTEVEALRKRGFQIETASINNSVPPVDGFPARELAESERTYYVKATPKLRILTALLRTIFFRPGVVFRGLRLALSLSPWNLPATVIALFYLLEALLVGEWMRRNASSHLHVHFSGPVATVALLVSRAWNVPYSLSVHGPDDFYNIETYYVQKKIACAHFVTCISDFCRSQLLRLVPPEQWHKFHVCRLGIDESAFRPKEGNRSQSATRVVSIGRLHPSKGQPILLKSIAGLIRQGLDVHLDLIGGGNDHNALERMIEKLALTHAVTLHGALSHSSTRDMLQQADIFVLSSFAEGLPVSLMEAMASEIACISTFIAGVPELITPNEHGILVPPASVDALTSALAQLIRDPARRRALAVAGRRKVLAEYIITRSADRLADVFRSYGLGTAQGSVQR